MSRNLRRRRMLRCHVRNSKRQPWRHADSFDPKTWYEKIGASYRKNGKTYHAGHDRAWSVCTVGSCTEVHHHGELMIRYDYNKHPELQHLSIGKGSVSDQRGMNTFFAAMGWRDSITYRRDKAGGGPRYVDLTPRGDWHLDEIL